jgi:hypothetical protein
VEALAKADKNPRFQIQQEEEGRRFFSVCLEENSLEADLVLRGQFFGTSISPLAQLFSFSVFQRFSRFVQPLLASAAGRWEKSVLHAGLSRLSLTQ